MYIEIYWQMTRDIIITQTQKRIYAKKYSYTKNNSTTDWVKSGCFVVSNEKNVEN